MEDLCEGISTTSTQEACLSQSCEFWRVSQQEVRSGALHVTGVTVAVRRQCGHNEATTRRVVWTRSRNVPMTNL
jgi:hypothetical protein